MLGKKYNYLRCHIVFHIFNSQEERIKYGGSAFIELQFCKLPCGISLSKIIDVDNIKHWMEDSLYIDDENEFYSEYRNIFNCGIYNNGDSGIVDIFGINYYSKNQIKKLIDAIIKEKPVDYELLVQWLEYAKQYNGFYILGI